MWRIFFIKVIAWLKVLIQSLSIDAFIRLEQKAAAGTITTAEQQELAAGADRLATARATDTDWIGEMTQTGLTMDHSLTLSGGTEKQSFSFPDHSWIRKVL